MVIKNIIKEFIGYNEQLKLKRTYTDYYNFWFDTLQRYVCNMFIWTGLPCSNMTMELYLLWCGVCGAVNKDDERLIVNGNLYGVTNYPTEFTTFIYATPKLSGSFGIDTSGTICNANRTRQSLVPLIDIYANQLAHADLSIQAALINQRANKITSATNQATADTVNTWYKKLAAGLTHVVIDKKDLTSFAGEEVLKTVDAYQYTSNLLTELYGIKQNLLRDFFTNIGFVSDKSKQERLVTAELSINSYRVLYGVSDMEKERKDFCERTNSLLGWDLSVKFNEFITDEINDLVDLQNSQNPFNTLKGGFANDLYDSATTESNTE